MTEESEPAYRRIADALASGIRSGTLAEGAKLPSVRALMNRHGVAYMTAHRALEHLASQGLAASYPGSGFYVRRTARIIYRGPEGIDFAGFAEADVVTGEVPAPAEVADAFGINSGAVIMARSWRSVSDSRPVQLAISFLPQEIAPGTWTERTRGGAGGIYARLGESGFAPTRFRESLVDRLASAEEAEQLNLSSSASRVIAIFRKAYCGNRCVEARRMILVADAFELDYEYPSK